MYPSTDATEKVGEKVVGFFKHISVVRFKKPKLNLGYIGAFENMYDTIIRI